MIFSPGLMRQEGRREQADDVIAFDELAGLVKQEAAVEVAIPGDAHIGPVGDAPPRPCSAVFRQQRIGDAVRERAIRLMMYLDELDGNGEFPETRLDGIDDMPGGAVARVDDELERLEVRQVNITQQVFHVGLQDGLPAQ